MAGVRFLVAILFACCAAAASAVEQPAAAAPAVFPGLTIEQELAALRPVPIGKRYLERARRALAVQLARMSHEAEDPERWYEDNALVVMDFVADVQVMYVQQLPQGARLVSHGMMRSWGLDPERLHQRALANLDARHGELRVKPVGRLPWLQVIDADDGYAASRVLLHWRWAELAAKLGGGLVLGMPTRDVVVFTVANDPDKLRQLRETVATVEQHQGRPISHRLFRWTASGWQEYEAPLQEPEQQGGEQRQH